MPIKQNSSVLFQNELKDIKKMLKDIKEQHRLELGTSEMKLQNSGNNLK